MTPRKKSTLPPPNVSKAAAALLRGVAARLEEAARRLLAPTRPTRKAPQRWSVRPRLEALEVRYAPAVFTVTSALDDYSSGKLR